ncbi:hypothetical protein BO71DRAFT_255773 [Aspergillus ellipticus CBS 707.79]|uniref:2EXR domain-containing protein n=1 Tax=Aspergillus ellipticus CBS 707.79 TaxID=1448320 RepID=A0A319D7H4_9EURO|nr:hypothetical protein BO71DRAFT_255773 [Aspergillus ellipticus CBS 707.79]
MNPEQPPMEAHRRRRTRPPIRKRPGKQPTPPSPPPPAELNPSQPPIPQTTSPLFTLLPPEIRNTIYAYTLESAPSATSIRYHRQAFYYRPGFQSPKRISTSLLQTCQQIYNEASLLPASLNEHTFWCHRPPPHVQNPSSPFDYFQRMTPRQRGAVRDLHFFTQQYFLEGNWGNVWKSIRDYEDQLRAVAQNPDSQSQHSTADGKTENETLGILAPKTVTITLRHSDWWFWEHNEPMGIDPFQPGRILARDMGRASSPDRRAWGNQFTLVPSLETLILEFETVMRKRDQMDRIVEIARGWRFPLVPEEGVFLVADEEWEGWGKGYRWIGVREGALNGRRLRLEVEGAGEDEENDGNRGVPRLLPLGGDQREGERVEIDPATEGEYYVVFLRWKKVKVDA